MNTRTWRRDRNATNTSGNDECRTESTPSIAEVCMDVSTRMTATTASCNVASCRHMMRAWACKDTRVETSGQQRNEKVGGTALRKDINITCLCESHEALKQAQRGTCGVADVCLSLQPVVRAEHFFGSTRQHGLVCALVEHTANEQPVRWFESVWEEGQCCWTENHTTTPRTFTCAMYACNFWSDHTAVGSSGAPVTASVNSPPLRQAWFRMKDDTTSSHCRITQHGAQHTAHTDSPSGGNAQHT